MKRFEYTTYVDAWAMTDDHLNANGQLGFELISVIFNPAKELYLYHFKRELPDETKSTSV